MLLETGAGLPAGNPTQLLINPARLNKHALLQHIYIPQPQLYSHPPPPLTLLLVALSTPLANVRPSWPCKLPRHVPSVMCIRTSTSRGWLVSQLHPQAVLEVPSLGPRRRARRSWHPVPADQAVKSLCDIWHPEDIPAAL